MVVCWCSKSFLKEKLILTKLYWAEWFFYLLSCCLEWAPLPLKDPLAWHFLQCSPQYSSAPHQWWSDVQQGSRKTPKSRTCTRKCQSILHIINRIHLQWITDGLLQLILTSTVSMQRMCWKKCLREQNPDRKAHCIQSGGEGGYWHTKTTGQEINAQSAWRD